MIKGEDYLNDNQLFTHTQIAKAAGCRPVLIMKYIQDGVRGVGKLRSEAVNEHGQPLVSIAALNEFGLRHSGCARSYAIKALKALRGAPSVERRKT
ncbi:hypothetical protein ES703_80013 [subsurface metagenome]